jgi:hypothetical protein
MRGAVAAGHPLTTQAGGAVSSAVAAPGRPSTLDE